MYYSLSYYRVEAGAEQPSQPPRAFLAPPQTIPGAGGEGLCTYAGMYVCRYVCICTFDVRDRHLYLLLVQHFLSRKVTLPSSFEVGMLISPGFGSWQHLGQACATSHQHPLKDLKNARRAALRCWKPPHLAATFCSFFAVHPDMGSPGTPSASGQHQAAEEANLGFRTGCAFELSCLGRMDAEAAEMLCKLLLCCSLALQHPHFEPSASM